MLDVFDDCAHENYQRTVVTTDESQNEHSPVIVKRKVALNQRAG